MVTRGASTGKGNVTRDVLSLSDGRLCHASDNRVNTINRREVDRAIRGICKKALAMLLRSQYPQHVQRVQAATVSAKGGVG
jgi:hypothetical protein